MIEMKSESVVLNGTPADVYDRLTHPGELQNLLDQAVTKAKESGQALPDNLDANLENISFTDTSISITAGQAMTLTFRLGDSTENENVQYVGDGTPVALIINFALSPSGMDKCMMAISIQADMPFFMRMMVQKPLQQGLNTFADMMKSIPSWRR